MDKQTRKMRCRFSKSVIILDINKYVDTHNSPYIRPLEFNFLRGKEYIIEQKMKKYIQDYKEAKINIHIQRNQNLCSKSTLQYFENYI